MITLFALPRAFQGHFEVIQRNAITSWARMSPKPEIILFGNEDGTADIARQLSTGIRDDELRDRFRLFRRKRKVPFAFPDDNHDLSAEFLMSLRVSMPSEAWPSCGDAEGAAAYGTVAASGTTIVHRRWPAGGLPRVASLMASVASSMK